MKYYHGTSAGSANNICSHIYAKYGRGELGTGFYVGNSLWRAYSWAWHKTKGKDYAVVEFSIDVTTLFQLNILALNRKKGRKIWNSWKKKNEPHLLHRDAVISPILGGQIYDAIQIKFESGKAETYINKTPKKIL